MSFDFVLIAIIVGGVGLSAAYVVAEYRGWREQGAAIRRREAALRSLHAARLSEQREDLLLPSVLQLQGFGKGQAANPDATELDTARAQARGDSPHARPLGDRRKRQRQRVGQ
ncbi:MAG TPA: hypothetical protein VHW71_10710 [Steroidobacteraceae bacterium]|jgi:hypothetical protein|nr:hypothetical protein [Steroidobacteraceae bacterium]